MRTVRGVLREVTPPHFENSMGGWTIDRIRIGDRTLTNIKVDEEVPPHLESSIGREVSLYLLRLPGGALPTSLTANLLGMKDAQTREKHVIPFWFARNSVIRYAVIPAFVWPIFGGVLGMITGTLLGFVGVTNEYVIVAPTAIAVIGGLVAAWGSAVLVALNYFRARLA